MKKLAYLIAVIIILPFLGFTQVIDTVDYMSPFHDGYAAVQKGDAWAIIDEEGAIVIDYRNDLVLLTMDGGNYPVLRNGMALIEETRDGVTYFGYIDSKGTVVIKPQFINARCFKHDKAVVTQLIKEKLGYNKVMDKPVVSYEYQEVVIDNFGEIIAYITEPKLIANQNAKSKIPKIRSEIIAKNLVRTKLEDNRVTLLQLVPKNPSL